MIVLDIVKLWHRHKRAIRLFSKDRPSDEDKRLLLAAAEALLAYRAIFGSSCWNGRDRVAFRNLENEINRYQENRR